MVICVNPQGQSQHPKLKIMVPDLGSTVPVEPFVTSTASSPSHQLILSSFVFSVSLWSLYIVTYIQNVKLLLSVSLTSVHCNLYITFIVYTQFICFLLVSLLIAYENLHITCTVYTQFICLLHVSLTLVHCKLQITC